MNLLCSLVLSLVGWIFSSILWMIWDLIQKVGNLTLVSVMCI